VVFSGMLLEFFPLLLLYAFFTWRKSVKPGEEIVVAKLPIKKQGQPDFIWDKFDKHLQKKLIATRLRGTPIETSAVIWIGWEFLRSIDQVAIEASPVNQVLLHTVAYTTECKAHALFSFKYS